MPSSRPVLHRASVRGFTLIELMVVVMIVAILAVIAVPSIVRQLRERRSAEAAQRVAALYRSARLRAMGRGSAVLVRFQNQRFEMLEAIQGAGNAVAGCESMPLSSCTAANFTTAAGYLSVADFNPTSFEGVGVTARDASDASSAVTSLDVCYTPLGRAFTRTLAADSLSPMTGVATFSVARTGGLARTVTVLPNGVARLAL